MANDNRSSASEKAWQLYTSDRYEEATNQINEALMQEPYNAWLHYLKADCLYRLNHCEEAEKHCKMALQYQYDAGNCMSLLGNIYTKQKDYAKAEAMYVKSLQVTSDNATVTARYAYLMLQMGQKEKARRLIERALHIDPTDGTANQIKAIYERMNQTSDKQKNIQKNMQKKETDVTESTSVQKKSISYQNTDTEDPYLRVCRNEKSRLCQIGYENLKAGKMRAARNAYKQALQMDEEDADIRRTIYHLDQKVHVIFLPERVVKRLGGVYLFGIELLVPILILLYFHLPVAALLIFLFYLVFCALAWFAPEIYQLIYTLHKKIKK